MYSQPKPQQTREETERLIAHVDSPVVLLGIRGYYRDTMGKPGINDISIWDDAIFVWSKNGHFAFNANTDPSLYRPRVASLKPGTWYYRLGIHNLSKPKSRQYPALVQAAPVTVRRYNSGDDTGWFGINIHRGGRITSNSTHSLGCQTIPLENWDGFFNLVKTEMIRAKIQRVPYVLIER